MQRLGLAVIVAFALIAFAYAETTCESHRRSSQNSVHGVRWNITCNEDGTYKPMQCTTEPNVKRRFCTCYNQEEPITGPSTKWRTCDCPLARDAAKDKLECEQPTCQKSGFFEPKQCCASSGMCRCVNSQSGEQTTPPTRDANLECPE